MKNNLIILFFLVCMNKIFSQRLSLKVDSIKVYYLSNLSHTSVSLSEDDVRKFDVSEYKNLNIEEKIKQVFTITQ